MLLTYGENADIPTKLSIFYKQAYAALFQGHDARKGAFKRKRLCTLDMHDFSRLFSAFCAITYDKKILQFSRPDALKYIDESIKILEIDVDKEKFLNDALQSVSLLIEDGLDITFTHRSFQEFFVANFIAESDIKIQRILLNKYCERVVSDNVVSLLFEMSPELIEKELLIPKLNEIFSYLKIRNSVGLSHLLKLMRINHSSVSVVRPSYIGLVVEKNSEWNYSSSFDILCFAVKNSPQGIDFFGEGSFLARKEKSEDFTIKYSGEKESKSYQLSELSNRSPILKDLSNLEGILSVKFIELALKKKRQLEKKHKRVSRTLEEIFSR